MTAAELEIALHRRDAESYHVDLRFHQPGSDADVRPAARDLSPLRFDSEAFARATDPAAYGRELAQRLFTDANVATAFTAARAVAASNNLPLRVRLFIGPSAPELHNLRWETLLDPATDPALGTPLLTNEAIVFSRYLSSLDWRPVRVRPKRDLTALVVVAAPGDSPQWGLAAIDVAQELATARAGLTGIACTEVAAPGTATLANILHHLRDEFDILYIVAHGKLHTDGEPLLYLENDEAGKAGKTKVIPGSELVTRIRELTASPRLIVLASCQSAGPGDSELTTQDQGALAALGPRLAEAGVPAVLAMQGNISMATVRQFMPLFFAELQRDGQIDRALAVARGEVRTRPDWWMPVLFRGATWFELAHDRLVTPVQEANAAWFAANLSTLQRQAALWNQQNRPEGLLLRGDELVAAEQWATTQPPLEGVEDDFLQACRAERTRTAHEARQNQWIRWLAIGATVVALLALVAAAWGWIERGRAENAKATAEAETARANAQANLAFTRQLLAQADQVYDENPLLGLRLALEAGAHLTHTEPIFQSQIISTTASYMAQGRIATLGTNVAGFIDVPGTPWLIATSNVENGTDQLYSTADGLLVTELTGSVSRIEPVSSLFPYFIVYYDDGTPVELYSKLDSSLVAKLARSVNWVNSVSTDFPFFVVDYDGTSSELRSKLDGSLVAKLTSIVNEVNPISTAFPFFVVSYTDGAPSELRRKADGALVPGLTGLVNQVDNISDISPFFIVNYTDGIPSELRRKADGALVPGLTGLVDHIYPISDTFPFFVVSYHGKRGELRSKTDSVLISTLAGLVNWANPISDTSLFFVVTYIDGKPSELRSKTDGKLVAELAGSVKWIDPISADFPFFLVSYTDGTTASELRNKADGALVSALAPTVNEVNPISTDFPFFVVGYNYLPSELRSKADGTLVSTLTGSVSEVNPISEAFPFFVLDYNFDLPSELRSKANSELVNTLAGSVSEVDVINETFPFFVVDYRDDMPSELLSKADGVRVSTSGGWVSGVYTISATSPLFIVEYRDSTPSDELRSKADGALIPGLTGLVDQIYTISDTSPFFVVSYKFDLPSELRSKADGALMSGLTGLVYQIYTISDTSPFFIVRYYGSDTPSELRSKTDGALVDTLTDSVDQVYTISATSPFFVVRYDGILSELRSIANGKIITGSVNEINPISDAFPFFVVDYYDSNMPRELRSKIDGAQLSWLTGLLDGVNEISNTSPFFVVSYKDGTSSELRRKANGTLVTDEVEAIDDTYPLGYFFVKRSNNHHTELWQLDPLRRLADLGIGLPWAGNLSLDTRLFNEEAQTLAIRYEDGRAFLLDLMWLEEMQERSPAAGLSSAERLDLACLPFAIHRFDDSLLQAVEYLGHRPSLACPQPVRLIEQGRHAARQLDVMTARNIFHTALIQDPTLTIEPAAEAARLAAQSLVRQGRLLLLQGEQDAAAAKFAQARDYNPSVEIKAELQELVASQLRTGKDLLTAGHVVSATLRLDALVGMDKAFGPGTLEQPTNVTIGQAYMTIGQTLAETGHITASTSVFAKALLLDPAQKSIATTQAKTLAAQTLLAHGGQLARAQKLAEAITAFADALTLDPSLGIDAEREAKRLAAAALVEQGQTLAKWGHGQSALDWFAKAKALNPSLDLDPVAEVTRLAPTPTATAPPSPLATPTPSTVSPLATPTATAVAK